MNTKDGFTPRRSWPQRFADAFRGFGAALAEGGSFHVHLTVAGLVLVCGLAFRVTHLEWGLLLLCIALVMAAEMFNSALESLARAVDEHHNANLGKALDMASGAVLLSAAGAASVGLVIFVNRLAILLGWW
jgi:diacylglycerol kinase